MSDSIPLIQGEGLSRSYDDGLVMALDQVD